MCWCMCNGLYDAVVFIIFLGMFSRYGRQKRLMIRVIKEEINARITKVSMHLCLCVVISILLHTLSHIILLAVKKEDEEIDEQAKKNDDKKEDVLELETILEMKMNLLSENWLLLLLGLLVIASHFCVVVR